MPDADFREFRWQPTDPTWSDVRYVQTRRQAVIPAPGARRRGRSRNGPVIIIRHARMCDDCNLQAARSGVCGC
jgi:hypothetical protein